MKYKVVRDKKKGETRIDYFKVINPEEFRFETLKKLLKDEVLIISIDTNLSKIDEKAQDFAMRYEDHLKTNGVLYEVRPIANTREKRIFGIPMKTKEDKAFNIIFTIKAEHITKDFFDQYLSGNDLLIGIQPKKSFEEITNDLQKGYLTSFFDKAYFENTLYDSIMICSLRITKILEDF